MKDIVLINGIEYVPKVVTAPEPVKVGRWKPEIGEEYWRITRLGDISIDVRSFLVPGFKEFKLGNIYQTKEIATKARDKQMLLVELQDYADEKNSGKEISDRYFILVEYSSGWDWGSSMGITPGTVIFRNSDDAKLAIEHFGSRLDLLL